MSGSAPGSFMHDLTDSLQQAYEVAYGYNRVDRGETHRVIVTHRQKIQVTMVSHIPLNCMKMVCGAGSQQHAM